MSAALYVSDEFGHFSRFVYVPCNFKYTSCLKFSLKKFKLKTGVNLKAGLLNSVISFGRAATYI